MINKKVSFLKIRDVKSPNRANQHDAGTDFFMPEYTPEFFEVLTKANLKNKIKYSIVFDTQLNKEVLEVIIPSGEQVNIPSGIKVWIHDKNTYLKATNKSGIASKKHLDVMANTIDADYTGEVHLNLCNNGNDDTILRSGNKVVQFIHMEYIPTEWEEETEDEYLAHGTTDRSDGGFGSTGLSK